MRLAEIVPNGVGARANVDDEKSVMGAKPEIGATPAALAALAEAHRAVAEARGDADRALRIVAGAARSVVPRADGAAIELLEGDRLVYRAASGVAEAHLGLSLAANASLSGLSIRLSRPLLSEDCETDPRVDREACRRVGIRSMAVVPVFRRESAVGVLKLQSAQPSAFTEVDAVLAQLLVGALDVGFADAAEREADRARVASDAALAVSEAQFRTTADALPGLLFLTSADGRNIHVNKGFRAYTGRADEELLGDRWLEALHPDDARRGKAIWTEAVRTGQPYEAEHRFRRYDGVWRWHVVRGLPVGEDGAVQQWVGCCVDIHERRLSEEELQRRIADALAERRLWAEIVEASDAFIQVLDPELRILAINRANADEMERMYGVRPRAGERFDEALRGHPQALEEASVLWRRALAGKSHTHLGEYGGANRDKRWYEMKFSPLFTADGRLMGALRISYDVTVRLREQRDLAASAEELRHANARLRVEMKRREEAQAALLQAQKLEALGQLTSGIAHDFNNVTQAVALGLALIEKRTNEPQIAAIARSGAKAAQRGGHLVKQLLAFASQQDLARSWSIWGSSWATPKSCSRRRSAPWRI